MMQVIMTILKIIRPIMLELITVRLKSIWYCIWLIMEKLIIVRLITVKLKNVRLIMDD